MGLGDKITQFLEQKQKVAAKQNKRQNITLTYLPSPSKIEPLLKFFASRVLGAEMI